MKRMFAMMLTLLLVLPASALERARVEYLGGTSVVPKAGLSGAFDMTATDDLVFRAPGGDLKIPYAAIDHYDYRVEMAHHLGVLPAIGVGLVAKRMRRRFITITYHDVAGSKQVAEFEVAPSVPKILMPILAARTPRSTTRTIDDHPDPFR